MIFKTRIRAIGLAVAFGTLVSVGKASSTDLVGVDFGEDNIVSYGGSDSTFFSGVDLNSFVGANTLYGLGYTGSRAVAANIEGGFAWGSHEALDGRLSQTYAGGGALSLSSSSIMQHATQTTTVIGGVGTSDVSRGIANGAGLWSFNIATALATNGSFSTSYNSLYQGYKTAMQTGIGGRTADVINSSWGFTSTNTTTMRTYASGATYEAVMVDALVNTTNRLAVFSAGNNGNRSGTLAQVGGISAGFNTLSVGATGINSGEASSSYNARAYFSANGLNPYYNPVTGAFVNNARVRVDIVAPGQGFVLPYLPAGLTDPTYWTAPMDGTSFSAPMVAGAGALLADVAYDKYAANSNSRDNRVLTAVLLNSADKFSDWTNAAYTTSAGVYTTNQALDARYGAG